MRVTLDCNSTKTLKSKHKNSAIFEFDVDVTRHSGDHEQITLQIELQLQAAPAYSAFKQEILSKVEIRPMEKNRAEDYKIIADFYQNITNNILDWTHLHLDQANE